MGKVTTFWLCLRKKHEQKPSCCKRSSPFALRVWLFWFFAPVFRLNGGRKTERTGSARGGLSNGCSGSAKASKGVFSLPPERVKAEKAASVPLTAPFGKEKSALLKKPETFSEKKISGCKRLQKITCFCRNRSGSRPRVCRRSSGC